MLKLELQRPRSTLGESDDLDAGGREGEFDSLGAILRAVSVSAPKLASGDAIRLECLARWHISKPAREVAAPSSQFAPWLAHWEGSHHRQANPAKMLSARKGHSSQLFRCETMPL